MITEFSVGQEKEVSELVKSLFDEFIAVDYSDEGNEIFNDFICPKNILERYKKGNIILNYSKDDKIVGMIEVRDNNHICLFFVHKKYQGQGVGKQLLLEIRNIIQGKTDFIDVNASPNSVKIYFKLGFNIIDYQKVENGMIITPMKLDF